MNGRDAAEIARRRTFAIISHPDAGKTTLTEKLLLYSGAVHLAGSVRAKKATKFATSDWMELERTRGISITSTALQFEYEGRLFNLLDTPGHQDFSEDTYRTLMAVDNAVMVLDAAKGVETQTRKLFEVCRRRRIPILTFINKIDQSGRDPLELIDEVERTLGIAARPMNWPVGQGLGFHGLLNLETKRILRYAKQGVQQKSDTWEEDFSAENLVGALGEQRAAEFEETLALLEAATPEFQMERFRAGQLTPVYFGSALKNFGTDVFLDALAELASPPLARMSSQGAIDPAASGFSAFVFKIQANMDPKHRDRMAFFRICSGRFEKDMTVFHPRLGRKVRIGNIHRMFARERESLEEAFAGDVVGLVNPGIFSIGDTVCDGQAIEFEPIPRFQPEHFGVLHNLDVSKSKQFRRGIEQLEEEGVVQVFHDPDSLRREPIVAAVGRLQFDVVSSRLEIEYGVSTRIEALSVIAARWVNTTPEILRTFRWPSEGVIRTHDREGRLVALFSSKWEMQRMAEEHPELGLSETS